MDATALPGDGIVRIAVNHGGKRTSVSMDSAIWGLLVAHAKTHEAAREWVRASASAMEVLEVRSPSLSRRIQSAIINSCASALRANSGGNGYN